MFIKHGDGKIVSVVDEGELTDVQKKAAKDLSKTPAQSGDQSDTSSVVKKSGS